MSARRACARRRGPSRSPRSLRGPRLPARRAQPALPAPPRPAPPGPRACPVRRRPPPAPLAFRGRDWGPGGAGPGAGGGAVVESGGGAGAGGGTAEGSRGGAGAGAGRRWGRDRGQDRARGLGRRGSRARPEQRGVGGGGAQGGTEGPGGCCPGTEALPPPLLSRARGLHPRDPAGCASAGRPEAWGTQSALSWSWSALAHRPARTPTRPCRPGQRPECRPDGEGAAPRVPPPPRLGPQPELGHPPRRVAAAGPGALGRRAGPGLEVAATVRTPTLGLCRPRPSLAGPRSPRPGACSRSGGGGAAAAIGCSGPAWRGGRTAVRSLRSRPLPPTSPT